MMTRQRFQKQADKLYYWIVGVSNDTGRRIIYGYKNSYQEAQLKAASINNAQCEIIALKTRDEKRATRALRAGVLDETGDIDESLRKFRHTID